jgi:hypothetical protein
MTPQTQQIYEHMKANRSITQIEAYELYGITRVASRIHELRQQGVGIIKTMKTGKNRFGVNCRYAEYKLGARA